MKAHVPSAVRRLVVERATDEYGVGCERCGRYVGPGRFQIHHRCAKGMGGSSAPWIDLASNLVLLCGTSSDGCHGLATEVQVSLMRSAGWVVPYGFASRLGGCSRIPAVDMYSRWWLFGDDGTKRRWTSNDFAPESLT